MEINKLVFGGLIAGCLAAAGGGAYLATRHNAQDTQGTAQTGSGGGRRGHPERTARDRIGRRSDARTDARGPGGAGCGPGGSAPGACRRGAAVGDPDPGTQARSASAAAGVGPARAAGGAGSDADTLQRRVDVGNASRRAGRDARGDGALSRSLRHLPAPEFVELVVPADAVMGLQLETTVSSERARVEDSVDARVTRDVRVGGRVAIPAGSMVHGTVTEVERGGKVRERAKLSIRFHTVVLGNGDRLALRTDAITREGASPGRESAAKIGGAAVGGAILGAILGGGKGAAIGAGVGAGGGTAAVMAGERNTVTIPAGSTVSVRIQQPVSVTVEKE